MFQPRADAVQMRLVGVARPPGDIRGVAGGKDHNVAGGPSPLPPSSTSPVLPARNFSKTAEIGAWLRWNAAASSRPSGSTGRPSLPNSTTYSATATLLPDL